MNCSGALGWLQGALSTSPTCVAGPSGASVLLPGVDLGGSTSGWKLELKRFNTSQCGNFFTYKIAPIWNRLPTEAVNSASVEQFKIELDKVIDTLIFFFFFFFFF